MTSVKTSMKFNDRGFNHSINDTPVIDQQMFEVPEEPLQWYE